MTTPTKAELERNEDPTNFRNQIKLGLDLEGTITKLKANGYQYASAGDTRRLINAIEDLRRASATVERKDEEVPVAWVIPGQDNARDNGFIDAMAWEEGEFSKPLYAAPPTPSPSREKEAAPTRNRSSQAGDDIRCPSCGWIFVGYPDEHKLCAVCYPKSLASQQPAPTTNTD